MKFSSMKLDESLLEAIDSLGFTEPTEIQQDSIKPALKGRDVLACAKTGSGKTAAFLLPIMHHLLKRERGRIYCLVLAPTRELAAQVVEHMEELAVNTDLTAAAIFGGVAMGPQLKSLERGVDILVATPGRLLDHIDQGNVDFDNVEYLVLDEADRMLDMGFLADVRRVIDQLPPERQNLLFSATMPNAIGELADELLNRPTRINVERLQAPPDGVRQATFPVPEHLKRDLLLHILKHDEVRNLLIFTRTKHRVNRLAQFLKKNDIPCDRLHGNRTQAQRMAAMKAFKDGTSRVLVATNLAARGIDVIHLSHVLSFDVPQEPEEYVHRVGRTARADLSGDALTFYTPEEAHYVRQIERALGHALPKVTLPDFDYAKAPEEVDDAVSDRVATLRQRREERRSRGTKRRRSRRGRRGTGTGTGTGKQRAAGGQGGESTREGRRGGRPGRGQGNSGRSQANRPRKRQGGGEANGNVEGGNRNVEAGHRKRGRSPEDGNRPRRGQERKPREIRVDESGQPIIPAEFDLPDRDSNRPRRTSHQPAALSGGGRRFLVD